MRIPPALLLTALALGGCGFHPVYQDAPSAQSSPVAAELAQVGIDLIADRSGQVLRNELIDRMQPGGVPIHPTYQLHIVVAEERNDMGLRQDGTSTVSEWRETAAFTLTEIATNKQIMQGTSRGFTRSNIVDSQFGTLLSAEDAKNRALRTVADDLVTRLTLYFDKKS